MNAWTGAANVFAEPLTSPTRRRDLTVRPTSILDPRFRYMPSNCTDVTVTWRRFGFNPQRNAERRGEIGGHSDPQACNFLREGSADADLDRDFALADIAESSNAQRTQILDITRRRVARRT